MTAPTDRPDRSKRRFHYSRAAHRARSHESAHADDATGPGEGEDHGGGTHHPSVPRGKADLVLTDEQLEQLIAHLRSAGTFAYDSEFIGELTYFPKLCLIQTSTADRVSLIDPLAGVDLRPFWELLADGSVEKVVHAGQQDVEPVWRHIGKEARNVFDTQIAAGFVGLPYPLSLSKLVGELTGAKLGKGLTFTQWDQRPLSATQLRYAADDVRYLPLARQELGRRLEAAGHAAWAAEECAAMTDPVLYRFDPDASYLRVRGATSLQPRNLAVLRELTIWRDAAARAEDVPPRTFLRDEILIDMSRSPIRSVERLERVRGLPRPVEKEHGRTIVEITARALSSGAPGLPSARDFEPTPKERFRSDALWAAAQVLCTGRNIDPALVASRQDISDLFRALSDGHDPAKLKVMQGWRRQVLGDPLLRLYRGETKVDVRWDKDTLRAEPSETTS
jgi:ribonuclease D